MDEKLNLDLLPEMKKAAYLKVFKQKVLWRKAKAAIFLVDYKLDGKKSTLAIPFKKEAEMKKEMKRLKKDKLHLFKKSAGGLFSLEKGADGEELAKVELLVGGLAAELLQEKGEKLFDLIKTKLEVIVGAAAELETSDAAEEQDGVAVPEKKITPEVMAKIKENMQSMQEVLEKMKSQLKIS